MSVGDPRPVFDPRAVYLLVLVGILAFGGAAYIAVFGLESGTRIRPDASARSYAAIGHRAFLETLDALGFPVIVSRAGTAGKVTERTLTVAISPPVHADDRARLAAIAEAPNFLLVLPKRGGPPHPLRREWNALTRLLGAEDVARVAQVLLADAEVRRPAAGTGWRSALRGGTPTLENIQLLKSDGLLPIVSADQGILLGKLKGAPRQVWVLADPDLLDNLGIDDGDNVHLAMRMIEVLLPADGTVLIDDSLHRPAEEDSVWRAMFGFPFNLVMLNLALAALAIYWSAAVRFGAPRPIAPPVDRGNARLVDNMALLLSLGGHTAEIFKRYVAVIRHDAAQRLHAPQRLTEREIGDYLDRLGAGRGASDTFSRLARTAASAASRRGLDRGQALSIARRLHRWKQEVTDGS